jgi:hypothetical protein
VRARDLDDIVPALLEDLDKGDPTRPVAPVTAIFWLVLSACIVPAFSVCPNRAARGRVCRSQISG